jgi:hypothetical protein
MSID